MDASKLNALNALLATMSEEQRQLFSTATAVEVPSPSITPQSKALRSRKTSEEGQGSKATPTTPVFNPLSPVKEQVEQSKDVASPSSSESEFNQTSSSTDSEEDDSPVKIPDVPILKVPVAEESRQLRKRPLEPASDQSSAKKLKRPARSVSQPKPEVPKAVSTSTASQSFKPFKFPRPYEGDEPLSLPEGRFKKAAIVEPLITLEQELLQFAESLDLSAAIDLLRQHEWLHMESEPFDYDPDQIRAFYSNLAIAPPLQSPANPDINLNEHCCILWHDEESFTISPRMVGELLGLTTGGDRFATFQTKNPPQKGLASFKNLLFLPGPSSRPMENKYLKWHYKVLHYVISKNVLPSSEPPLKIQ